MRNYIKNVNFLAVWAFLGMAMAPVAESWAASAASRTELAHQQFHNQLMVHNGRHKKGEIFVKYKSSAMSSTSIKNHISSHIRGNHSIDSMRSLGDKRLFSSKEHRLMQSRLGRWVHVALSEGTNEEAVLKSLRADPRVEHAELNYEVSIYAVPNDPQFSSLWALNNTGQTGGLADADIDAPEAWDVQTGGSVVVAVIDTGVDYTHPDLSANMWSNSGEIAGNGIDDDGNGYIDDIYGYDFANNDGDPMDDNRHGTHVSGTIAAVGDNNIGVVGVSWNAKIMALKFLAANGSGYTDDAVGAVAYAIQMGARIMNNSWGGGGFSQVLRDAISDANDAGILFVAAAGNSAANTDNTVNYPSGYDLPNVISIAATDSSDQIASFSNYGRLTVDMGAPGVSILSTVPNNGYAVLSGTSMATPHVSGAAALLLAENGTLTANDLKALLMGNADAISTLAGVTRAGARLNLASSMGCDPSQEYMLFAEPGTGYEALRDTIYVDEPSTTISIYVHQCTQPILGASVTVDFDNGEPSLSLYDDGLNDDIDANDGIYGVLWDPVVLGATTMTVTARTATNFIAKTRSVQVVENIDVDADGLDNDFEVSIGTDPLNSDSDTDGLTDYYEVCYDGDCTSYAPYPAGGDANALNEDTDSDGFLDIDEYYYAGDLANPSVGPWTQVTLQSTPAPTGAQKLYGIATANVGDIDGDGINDLAVGQPYGRSGNVNVVGGGKLYLYSGRDESLLFEIDGPADAPGYASLVLTNGDIDQDGVNDIIITSDYAAGSPSYALFTYSGADGTLIERTDVVPYMTDWDLGVTLVAMNYDLDGDGMNDLLRAEDYVMDAISGYDGSVIFRYPAGSYTGPLEVMGDLDNDGIPEILVGNAYAGANGLQRAGRAKVMSGADGAKIYGYAGVENADYLGASVSGLGDIDQDGVPDFAIGSLRAMFLQRLDTGLVTVYSGATGTEIYRLEGPNIADWFSFVAPFDLGDDNIPDIMVTARLGDLVDGAYDNSGTIYVFRGSDGTLATEVHPTNGMYGRAAISAGDLNRDGVDDMFYTRSASVSGEGAYVLLSPPLPPVVNSWKKGGGPFVSVFGAYLTGTTDVTFNGAPALGYLVYNYREVRAIRPADVSTGPICVTTPVGTACTPTDYVPPPIVDSWTQGGGPFVFIEGNNLQQTTGVTFNGVRAMGFHSYTPRSLLTIRPLNTSVGRICVTTTSGSACTQTDYIP